MLYLDTANLAQIKRAEAIGIIQGVTTNPTILLKESQQREEIIKAILAVTNGTVFVQTVGTTVKEILSDARHIFAVFKDEWFALKILVHLERIEEMKYMKTV